MKIELMVPERPGRNGLKELRSQLDVFVRDKFELLYEGATRLGLEIPKDWYTCRRVQVGDTRLHEREGLKYADGHRGETTPPEEQIRQTVADLQRLLDAAAEEIEAPFSIKIEAPFSIEKAISTYEDYHTEIIEEKNLSVYCNEETDEDGRVVSVYLGLEDASGRAVTGYDEKIS